MGESYIQLPETSGYMVEWETGETFTLRSGRKINITKRFFTTSVVKAKEVTDQKISEGYKNVKLRPAIF